MRRFLVRGTASFAFFFASFFFSGRSSLTMICVKPWQRVFQPDMLNSTQSFRRKCATRCLRAFPKASRIGLDLMKATILLKYIQPPVTVKMIASQIRHKCINFRRLNSTDVNRNTQVPREDSSCTRTFPSHDVSWTEIVSQSYIVADDISTQRLSFTVTNFRYIFSNSWLIGSSHC